MSPTFKTVTYTVLVELLPSCLPRSVEFRSQGLNEYE